MLNSFTRFPKDLIIAVFLSSIGLLMLSERFTHPPFWDEILVYFTPLWDFAESPMHFLLHRKPVYYERPPGLLFLYLPSLMAFGKSIFAIRVQNFFMFCGSMYFLYKIFSFSLPDSKKFIAALSVLLLLLIPSFTVYSTQFVGPPQLIFLFSLQWFLFLYFPRRLLISCFVGFLAGFGRETSLALVPVYLCYFLSESPRKKLIWYNSLSILIGFITNPILNFIRFGEITSHLSVREGHLLSKNLFQALTTIHSHLLLPYKLTIPLLVTIFVLLLFFRRIKNLMSMELIGSLIISISFVVFFSLHQHAIVRYFWFAIPFISYTMIHIVFI